MHRKSSARTSVVHVRSRKLCPITYVAPKVELCHES
jgi:hypothetical protein